MLSLLVLREKLKSFYGKYSMFIIPVIKFLVVFAVLFLLNRNIGYRKTLLNPFIPPIVSLVCCVLPYSGICWITAGYILFHVSAVSPEMMLIMALFLLITALLYYSFQPGDSFLLLLTPLMFACRIPYVVPILVGLGGSIVSIVPVSCGIVIYYMLQYVNQNAGQLTNDASVDITQKFVQMINGIVSNRTLLLMIIAFAVTILVVSIFRNLSVDYSRVIAIIAGMVALLVTVLIGDFLFGVSIAIGPLLLGVFISAAAAFVYNFMIFNVDYTRTEFTQFEDDDYYYYVKAVPKISVSAPDVRVKRINRRKGVKDAGNH